MSANAPIEVRSAASEAVPPTSEPGVEPRPRWPVLAAILVLGYAAGIYPLAVIIDKPLLIGAAAVLWALGGILAARRITTASTTGPSPWEIMLGAASVMYPAALVSAFALIVYGAIEGVGLLLHAVGLIDSHARHNIDDFAIYPASIGALLTAPIYGNVAISNVAGQLYPLTAGVRSPFAALLSQPNRRLAIVLLAALTIAVGVSAALLKSQLLAVILLCLLSVSTASVFQIGFVDRTLRGDRLAIVIASMLRQRGFTVVDAPRLGDDAVDPLLAGLDLLAYNQNRAFALYVSTSRESRSRVAWADAASVQIAATALSPYVEKLGVESHRVEPVLVVLEGADLPALEAFCREQAVHLVELDRSDPLVKLASMSPERHNLDEIPAVEEWERTFPFLRQAPPEGAP